MASLISKLEKSLTTTVFANSPEPIVPRTLAGAVLTKHDFKYIFVDQATLFKKTDDILWNITALLEL